MADAAIDKKEVVPEEETLKKSEKDAVKIDDSAEAESENGSGDAESPKENGDEKVNEVDKSAENGDSTEVAPAPTKRKSVGESGDAVEGENGDAAKDDGETPEKKAKLDEKVATPTKVSEENSANGEAEAVA